MLMCLKRERETGGPLGPSLNHTWGQALHIQDFIKLLPLCQVGVSLLLDFT